MEKTIMNITKNEEQTIEILLSSVKELAVNCNELDSKLSLARQELGDNSSDLEEERLTLENIVIQLTKLAHDKEAKLEELQTKLSHKKSLSTESQNSEESADYQFDSLTDCEQLSNKVDDPVVKVKEDLGGDEGIKQIEEISSNKGLEELEEFIEEDPEHIKRLKFEERFGITHPETHEGARSGISLSYRVFMDYVFPVLADEIEGKSKQEALQIILDYQKDYGNITLSSCKYNLEQLVLASQEI